MKHSFTRRLLKSAVGIACAGAMVATQTSFAWAASYSYPVPSSPSAIDKSLVTVGQQGDIWAEVLGISNVASNYYNDFNSDGTPSKDGVASNIVVQLFGSDVNVNPNPYYTNLIYNANAATDKQVDHYSFADKSGLGTGIDRGDNTLLEAYGGVSSTISHRPDILIGNCATSWQDPGAIVLRKDGETWTGIGDYNHVISAAYDPQVTTIRSFKKGDAHYQAGDGLYNPVFVENLSMYGDVYSAGNSYSSTGEYNKGIDDDGTDHMTFGVATTASTYGMMYRIVDAYNIVKANDPDKTTRYGDPNKIAAQYESYGRGLQYYVLSKIADKTVSKKKVAVVSGVSTDANTVTLYKSSPANTTNGTGSSFSGGYRAMEALENITENIAGVRSTADYAASGWSKAYAVTSTITDPKELLKADCIILTSASQEASIKTLLTGAGVKEADMPAMFVNRAASTSRGIPGFPALGTDGLELSAQEIGFVYPEIVNPVYAMAYYFTQFYHVKSDTNTLTNVLNKNIENMTLPKGVTADLSNYNDSVVDGYINAGLKYYANNKADIDAASAKLILSSRVELPAADSKSDTPAVTPAKTVAKAQTLTFKSSVTKAKTLKAKSGKLAATKTFTVKVTGAKTTVTYKLASVSSKAKKYIKINAKTGKITVKKGLKKGTYKIKVKASAKATSAYKAATKTTKTITIKVK